MTTLQAIPPEPLKDIPYVPIPSKRPWWRSCLLFVLLLFSIIIYVALIGAAPKADNRIMPFLYVWIISFLPYFIACALVLATKPARGRWQWVEMGIILGGALVLRIMLLPLPPGLSHDSWRYLWDARVILHGYSPYVYAPLDGKLAALRDTLILGNSRFRNVPTIYPPGAQAVFVLSYLLAPSNLFVLKGIFVGFDMVTCGALALLLARRGLDPRRVILYAWCPLPIIEFAIQGHVDVITLTFTVLPVLTATSTMRGARVLTGILIGLGTLTKFYPILLLVVLLRRREWTLKQSAGGGKLPHLPPHPPPPLLACFATIILGYIPFLILGHGQVLGFFFTYAAEQGTNAGVIQQVVHWISSQFGLTLATTILLERIVDLVLLGTVSLAVLILRVRERISVEAATLLLIGTFLSISSHVFPWYTTALLPWVVMLVGPLWTRKGLNGKGIAIAAVWYFSTTSLLGYFFNYTFDWSLYYALVYGVVMGGLALAVTVIVRSGSVAPLISPTAAAGRDHQTPSEKDGLHIRDNVKRIPSG